MTLSNRLEYIKAAYAGYRQGGYSLDELKCAVKDFVKIHPIQIGAAVIVAAGLVHNCNYAAFNAAGVHYRLYPFQHQIQLEHKFDRLREIKVEAASNSKKAVKELDDILDWLEYHQQIPTADVVYRQADTAIDEIIEEHRLPESTRKTRENMHIKKKDSK